MQDNLTELISSRICHDLISPVGAIGNGLELMEAMGTASPELELVGQSAQSAQAKLKFFRVAFGASGTAMIGGAEAQRVAADMFAAGRVTVSFERGWGERERALVKLFYLLLLCVESSLPRGGMMACAPTDSGWQIRVDNVPVSLPDRLWAHVVSGENGAATTATAKTIQFLLARQAMEAQGISVSLETSETGLALTF